MDSTNGNVVMLVDDSDDEANQEMDPAQPNAKLTVVPSENGEMSDSGLDVFAATVKRFLNTGTCFIDLSGADEKSATKCLNPFCTSGKNLIVAADFVKSYFNSASLKNQMACEACWELAIDHFKDLSVRMENGTSLFDANFSKVNPIVLIDSDEEDNDLDDQQPLPKEFIECLNKGFNTSMEDFCRRYDVDFQLNSGCNHISKTFDSLKATYSQWDIEIKNLGNELTQSMESLYMKFLPTSQELEPLDIPYEEMRPYILANSSLMNMAAKGVRNSMEVASNPLEPDVVELSNIVRQLPSNAHKLPPIGELVRPKPKPGDKVYVMKVTTFSEWIPATVEEVINKQLENNRSRLLYKVKIESKHHYKKEVLPNYMAYGQPAPVRFLIGTRVIALSLTQKNNPKKFFSGITAEFPSTFNNYRYLVFYDDGYVRYCYHNEIRLVCEEPKNVADYFHPRSKDFIRQYLDNYPERQLLRVSPMEVIRTEYMGTWQNARVKAIDGALVQMLFVKDFRTEWIYRGSTRLQPIFEKVNPARRHRAVVSNENEEKTEDKKNIEQMDQSPSLYPNLRQVSSVDIELETEEPALSTSTPPRAVARKSTAMVRVSTGGGGKSDAKVECGTIKSCEYMGPRAQRVYIEHKCAPKCLDEYKFSPEKIINKSPLLWPIIFGFRRNLIPLKERKTERDFGENSDSNSNKSENRITYEAPCSRMLRNYDEVLQYLKVTKSELTVELFDFDYWVRIYDEYVVPKAYVRIKDLSYGTERLPIPCVNSIDSSVPFYMDYRTKRRGCDGVFLNLDPGFLTCCDCTDDCSDRMKCACWQKTIQGYKALGKVNNTDPKTIGYQYRRLPEVVTTGIYECNIMCKCKMTCSNRVVQNPLRQKLQLFKTRCKGWGTRCVNDIPAGSFVCVYMGDILTEANANEGGKRYGDEYFAELDYIEVVESLKEDYEDEVIGPLTPEDMDKDKDKNDETVDLEERCRPSEEWFVPLENNAESALIASDGEQLSLGGDLDETIFPDPESDEEFEPAEYFQDESCMRMQLRARKSKGGKKGDESGIKNSEDARQPRIPSNFDANIPDDSKRKYPSVRKYYTKDESVFIMDAKTAGNIGRYLNHSCDPNIFVQNVFVDTHDLRFPWVAFFALRYIRAGTELTWDYRYEVGSVPGKRLFCYCETADCRGRLL